MSNTLGDSMVLQRAPQTAVVWGFGDVGVIVTTMFDGQTLSPAAVVGTDGTWRQLLPPTAAGGQSHNLTFTGSDGGHAAIRDVLFGEVYICGGQSNMAYTPLSMAGMNNATAEIASANEPGYRDIRLFTVGQGTVSDVPRRTLGTIYRNWTAASAKVVGGDKWKEFSAVTDPVDHPSDSGPLAIPGIPALHPPKASRACTRHVCHAVRPHVPAFMQCALLCLRTWTLLV